VRAFSIFLALALTCSSGLAAAQVPCGSCHDAVKDQGAHAKLKKGHEGLGCVDCHRGDPAATEKEAAHPTFGPDQLLAKARTGAACARCHVPGSVAGTEAVVAGGQIYLEQGCYLCHLGQHQLGNLAAFGPPLSTIGGRGTPYLQGMLQNPKATFKDTAMPSYQMALAHLPGSEELLLTYLLSLREDLGKPARPALSGARCATCHQSRPADKTKLAAHRCQGIKRDVDHFRCASCHKKAIPSGDQECLYIEQRRQECGVCHQGGIDEG
jgi:hypothetical protein